MNHTCDACGTSKEQDASKGRVPLGWRFQWIGKRVVLLCDACGFLCTRNGASSVLVDMLRARGIDVDKPDK